MSKKRNPLLQRYKEAKRQYLDALLIFKVGDFYELFFADAEEAAQTLNLALSWRHEAGRESVPMCGFPYYALESKLEQLRAINRAFVVFDPAYTPQ